MHKSTSTIVGIFDNEDKLLGSIKSFLDKGIPVSDVITPYPIHEVFDLLKVKTRIPVAAFFYGIFAIALTFLFLYWTSVVNYPLKFGGKPQNTLSFVIVIFVMTINITSLLTIVTFFLRDKKGPGAKARKVQIELTDDKYAILINKDEDMPEDEVKKLNALFQDTGAIEIMEQQN